MIKKIVLSTLLFITISACKQTKEIEKNTTTDTTFQFAKNISIQETETSITIKSSGNTVIFDKKELPIQTVMVETASAIAYLDDLNALNTLKGVSDADFVYNPKIASGIANKTILNIGNSNELFSEVILKNKPQLIIASSNPVLAKFHQQLEQNGIKILYLDEYKEQNPLGQVEYLKIFGKLFGKNDVATKHVETVKNSYDSIKNIIQTQGKGTVSTLCANKRFITSKINRRCKGNYIFNDKSGENSLSLTFEEVYKKGKTATHWINVTNFDNLLQMKASYPNYAWFDAFKSGNVYAYSSRMNAKGANDYFEKGIIRPDFILNDLGKIFYPNLFPKHELYFYKQLK